MATTIVTTETAAELGTPQPRRRVTIDARWATITMAASSGKKLPVLNRRQNPVTVASDSPTSAASAAGSRGRTLRVTTDPSPECLEHTSGAGSTLERCVPRLAEREVACDADRARGDEPTWLARCVRVPARRVEVHDRHRADLASKASE